MAWFKNLFSKKRNKQAKEVEKKAQTTAPEGNTTANPTKEAAFTKAAPSEEKERYTYFVGGVSTTEPWIFIICNEEDATWDSEPFTDLVKKAARIMNDGVWEGNILPAGIYQGDTRYRIKNDPTLVVFQYDTLFGIVLEYTPGIGLDGALNYLSNILGVTVDDKYRQATPVNKVPSALQFMARTDVGATNTPKEQKATTVLVIPEGTKEIKLSEYKDQKNITQIILPEGVESINAQAFSGCENLGTINFPTSLKSIGFSAFAHCKKLKKVHLPEGLESIDNSAFFECVNLEKINFPASLKRMGEYVFSTCTKLKSAGPYGSGASVEFGATDKLINDLFGSCHYLERVSLPEGLETIGSAAFRGCKYLTKINLPASLKTIRDQAFFGCEKLISAGPPNSGCSIEFSVTDRIPENMFMNCKNLNSVQLPAGITVIGESAFYNCKSLERITIPRGVEEIGARAFEFCGSLKHLVLPESVVKIGEGAFRGCDQLADHDGFIIIRSVLYGCLNLRDTITVPQGVTTIDSDAFVLGTSTSNDVTTTIVIPESVVSITHHRAFLRCKKLETVTIPENASDEVKQVAQVITDRAEERRRQQEKPKPVFIRTPDQLWVFRSANNSILSEEVYQAIISKFQEMRDKVIGKGGETDTRWSESAIMISLYDEDSHWVGHDDTVYESIELKLERLSKWEEPSEWTAESDLPCEGAYQYLNKSKNEGDSWSYSVMSHKAWLLKAPFGLPGVWSFEYISKHDR